MSWRCVSAEGNRTCALKRKGLRRWFNPIVRYPSLYRLNQQTDHRVYLSEGAGGLEVCVCVSKHTPQTPTFPSNKLTHSVCPSQPGGETSERYQMMLERTLHFSITAFFFSVSKRGDQAISLQEKYFLCWWAPKSCSAPGSGSEEAEPRSLSWRATYIFRSATSHMWDQSEWFELQSISGQAKAENPYISLKGFLKMQSHWNGILMKLLN